MTLEIRYQRPRGASKEDDITGISTAEEMAIFTYRMNRLFRNKTLSRPATAARFIIEAQQIDENMKVFSRDAAGYAFVLKFPHDEKAVELWLDKDTWHIRDFEYEPLYQVPTITTEEVGK